MGIRTAGTGTVWEGERECSGTGTVWKQERERSGTGMVLKRNGNGIEAERERSGTEWFWNGTVGNGTGTLWDRF